MRLLCPIAAAAISPHHAGFAVGRLVTATTIIVTDARVISDAAIQNRRLVIECIPCSIIGR
ncbi:MAG: hypothetical protein WKF77_31245 [Planctomycetaceae bacterium]